jgi:hypothetical protein
MFGDGSFGGQKPVAAIRDPLKAWLSPSTSGAQAPVHGVLGHGTTEEQSEPRLRLCPQPNSSQGVEPKGNPHAFSQNIFAARRRACRGTGSIRSSRRSSKFGRRTRNRIFARCGTAAMLRENCFDRRYRSPADVQELAAPRSSTTSAKSRSMRCMLHNTLR